MALDSNAQCDRQGSQLPHFTPYPTPGSAGVNVFNQDLTGSDGVTVNPYAFPPFSVIPSLLSLLSSQGAVTTKVMPCLSPLPSWWPMVRAMSSKEVLLARHGSRNAILCTTKQGFMPRLLSWDLWAFRVDRFLLRFLALNLFLRHSLCYNLCL